MHINYHANGGRGLCGGWLAVDLWLTRMSSSHLLLPEVFYHLDQMIWSFLFPVVFENVVFFSVFEMQKRMSYTVDKWFPDRASRSTCVFFPLQKYIFSKIIYSTVLLHKIYIWFKSVCLKIQCKRMAVHVHNCAYICMCTSALRSLINHHSAAIVSEDRCKWLEGQNMCGVYGRSFAYVTSGGRWAFLSISTCRDAICLVELRNLMSI